MPKRDDLFEDDPDLAAFAEEFDKHREAFAEFITGYIDDTQIDDVVVVSLLIDATLRARMMAYAAAVEKPSVAGLKLDLDRLRAEIDEAIRYAKKNGEEFIQIAKRMRAETEAEDQPD
jgi:ABC-type amino acid transport substrate-binding protein